MALVAGTSAWATRCAAPVATALAALGAVGTIATVDPGEPGHYPLCPLLATTGLYCPGCGSLRAVHALAHGDAATAWSRNPLTTLAVPLLIVLWVRWLARSVQGGPASRLPSAALVSTVGAVMVASGSPATCRAAPGWRRDPWGQAERSCSLTHCSR